MAIQNISKYVAINDFLLLEYEFSRDGTLLTNTDVGGGTVVMTDSSVKQYYNNNVGSESIGTTNNILALGATPTTSTRSTWFTSPNADDYTNVAYSVFDSSTAISESFEYDTVKVHVVSGYNFDDVAGFLLQVRAEDVSSNLVDLSNFAYLKQSLTQGSNVVKFANDALYLGNRFYDKYVTFKVPSIYALGGQSATTLESTLLIKSLSDVHLTYGTIATIQAGTGNTSSFSLADTTSFNLPVTSAADNFNAFIAESTEGDFIEFYATWKDIIIGEYMGDIESGRISLYTSNNPNDNYTEFAETYGVDTAKWVLIHEITVYENLPGVTSGSSLLSQKYTFTQENNFTRPNYFRPVLRNADIDSSFTIQYTCRLSNRMDGTQIIRKASFASTNPKKYGFKFTRLTVENTIPYKVFNRIEEEQGVTVQGQSNIRTKYSKVFYDTTNILYNQDGDVYPNGVGPLFLKNGDSVYKFTFNRFNELTDERENVDLSGAYNYALIFTTDEGKELEVVPTYSTNMNTTIGELEFKLTSKTITTLLKQKNNKYTLVVKNPDGTHYSFYEGEYWSNNDMQAVLNKYERLNVLERLRKENTLLNTTLAELQDKYNRLLAESKGPVKEEGFEEWFGSSSQTDSKSKTISNLTKANNNLREENDELEAEVVEWTMKYNNLLAGKQSKEDKPVLDNRTPAWFIDETVVMPKDIKDIKKARKSNEDFSRE